MTASFRSLVLSASVNVRPSNMREWSVSKYPGKMVPISTLRRSHRMQWETRCATDAFDSGNRAQAILQFAQKSQTALRGNVFHISNRQKREEAVGIIARIHMEQFYETAKHQTRSHKQHKGHGHFRDHHRRSNEAGGSQESIPPGP